MNPVTQTVGMSEANIKHPTTDLVPGPTVTSSSQQWSASRELRTLTDQWSATDQRSATTGLHWHRTNKKTLMEFKHRSMLGQPSKLAAVKKTPNWFRVSKWVKTKSCLVYRRQQCWWPLPTLWHQTLLKVWTDRQTDRCKSYRWCILSQGNHMSRYLLAYKTSVIRHSKPACC